MDIYFSQIYWVSILVGKLGEIYFCCKVDLLQALLLSTLCWWTDTITYFDVHIWLLAYFYCSHYNIGWSGVLTLSTVVRFVDCFVFANCNIDASQLLSYFHYNVVRTIHTQATGKPLQPYWQDKNNISIGTSWHSSFVINSIHIVTMAL